MLFQWHVTERCNLHCTHCYQQRPLPREPDFQEMTRVLEQFSELADHLGRPGHITVTGGEFFLHPDAWELLGLLSSLRPRFTWALLTNGTHIAEAVASRLAAFRPRFVQVSLEGTPATHDLIRGPGNYQRTVDAARALVRAGIPTLIAFTAHQDNYREFPHVALAARKIGVARVWADRLIPSGAGASLRTLTPEQAREFNALLQQEYDPHYRTEIARHRALQFLAGGAPYRCSAGDRLLAIQPDGDVYPCRRLPLRAGNLLETPLVEIYRDSPLLRALRDESRIPAGCLSCEFKTTCHGGLRCLAQAVTGDWNHADPGCWLAESRNPAQGPGQACGACNGLSHGLGGGHAQ